VLFGNTTPTSTDARGRSGSAYAGFTGTSAAAPHVAGVAALIKSILPNATPAQIRDLLVTTVRPYPAGSACATGGAFAGQCGVGLLDAASALQAAAATVSTGGSGSPAVPPTGSPAAPPVGGGGGGGALALWHLLLVALASAIRVQRREPYAQ
jgi:serine protease